MKDKLDELFAARDQRLRDAQIAKESAAEKVRLFQEQAQEVISRIVMPVLQEMVEDLKQRGHESSASHATQVYMPYATFRLKLANTQLPVSSLEFATHDEETIFTRYEVWSPKGKSEPSQHGKPSIAWTKLTPEWVENQLIQFIGLVLNKS